MLFLFVIKISYDHILTKKYLEVNIRSLSQTTLIPREARLINLSGGAEGPSRAKPRQFERKIYLTNRFHFAVRLYSDNAQMTSKRGENKEVRYEPQASSVTDVLTTF